ncbi:D-alanyl-D-alanine carboxypeptidase family protein [Virgibacillus kimchii]
MSMKYLVIAGVLFCFSFIFTGCNTESPSDTEEPPADETEHEEESTEPDVDEEADNILTEAPNAHMQKLDDGPDVEVLQQVLSEIGYDMETSGIYDDATTWAITDLQLQFDELMVTGIYEEDTSRKLDNLFQEEVSDFQPGEALPVPTEEVTTSHGSVVLANPYEQLALVNKEFALPEDYSPEDLVVPDIPFPFEDDLPQKQMREIAAEPLEEMFQAAEEAGLELYAQSGFRSYDRQDAIFASNVNQHGEEDANNFSARPGESEHQTGLSMDVTSPDVGFGLTVEFAETDEGKWLKEHAANFGYIIRYPEGKEDITQYQYEPWHLRYVGEQAAKEITEQDITFEEYLGQD